MIVGVALPLLVDLHMEMSYLHVSLAGEGPVGLLVR